MFLPPVILLRLFGLLEVVTSGNEFLSFRAPRSHLDGIEHLPFLGLDLRLGADFLVLLNPVGGEVPSAYFASFQVVRNR